MRLRWPGRFNHTPPAHADDGSVQATRQRPAGAVSGRRVLKASMVAMLSVAFFVWVDPPGALQDFDQYGLTKLALRFGMFAGLVAGLMVTWLSRNAWLHLISTVLLLVTLPLQVAYRLVTGGGFTHESAWLLLNSLDAVADAVAMYHRVALPGVLLTVGAVIFLSVPLRRVILFRERWALLLIPLLIGSIARTWYSGEAALEDYPVPFRVPAALCFLLLERQAPREAPYLAPADERLVPHIVLVVDESVTGEHLSINGYPRETTPFLASVPEAVCNFGVASSGGNCSYTSQAIVYGGIRQEEIFRNDPRIWQKPCIMQYAARAGYKCLFLDSQKYRRTAPGGVPKGTTRYVSTLNLEPDLARRDLRAAEELVDWIAQNAQTFTYVTKRGAHFPYEDHYPPEERVFRPTLDAAGWSDDPVRVRNSYDNAVRWACDGFFEFLLPRLESTGKEVLILYTSDHGQALPGTVPGTRATHGNADLPPITANVPLMAVATKPARGVLGRLRENTTARNNASHFDLFSTALLMMGYSPEETARHYGLSLMDPIPPDRTRFYVAGWKLDAGNRTCREFTRDPVGK